MSEQQSQLSPSCHRLPVCGSITLRKEMLLKYSDWHHLSRQSVKNPLETMDVLFQAVDIALVREWALLHQLSKDLVKVNVIVVCTVVLSAFLPVFTSHRWCLLLVLCLVVCFHQQVIVGLVSFATKLRSVCPPLAVGYTEI